MWAPSLFMLNPMRIMLLYRSMLQKLNKKRKEETLALSVILSMQLLKSHTPVQGEASLFWKLKEVVRACNKVMQNNLSEMQRLVDASKLRVKMSKLAPFLCLYGMRWGWIWYMNMKNADVLKVVNFSLDEPELETIVKRCLKKMIETWDQFMFYFGLY